MSMQRRLRLGGAPQCALAQAVVTPVSAVGPPVNHLPAL
jgi:hypothetical protein